MFNHSIVRQLGRFVLVGGVNTLIGLSTILLLRFGFGIHDVVANAIGYAAGISASFLLNRMFTFADRGPVASSLVRFMLSVAIAYLANLVTLVLSLHVLTVGSLAAQIVAMTAYSAVFFILARSFAFRDASR